MQSLIDTLTSFHNELTIEPGTALRRRMSFYNDKMVEHNRDFYSTPINANVRIKKLVQVILADLKVPHDQWGRYLGPSLTVYEFLVELRAHSQKENNEVKEFIGLIDEQVQLRWKKIIYGGAIALAVAELSWPFLLEFGIDKLLAAALFMPVVGLVYTATVAFYSLYKNLYDKNTPLFQRFRDNFFLLADAALKFGAYGVVITAAATATPVAAILFVVAEAFSVLKEIVSLVHIVNQDKTQTVVSEDDILSKDQHQARYDLDYLRRRNSILINMTAALISVGIVAAWCFVPGSIFVAIGVVTAIALMYGAKTWVHAQNKSTISACLKSKFEEVESAHQEKQGLWQVDGLADNASPDGQEVLTASSSPRSDRSNLAPGMASRGGMFAVGRPRGGEQLEHEELSELTF